MLRKVCASTLLASCLLFSNGCADPWYHIRSVNPWSRSEWAEDEAYLTTLHTKMSELQLVQQQAGQLSPGELQQWGQVLSEMAENEPIAHLRAEAVTTMAYLPPQLVDQGMRTAAKDGSPIVRQAACEAWSQRGDEASLVVLADILGSDTDQDVRMAAARSLGEYRDPRAVQALGLALEDKDPAIQYRAMQALKNASGEDFGEDILAWRTFVQGGYPQDVDRPSIVRRIQNLF